jgi:hypothetical protein
LAVFSFLSRGDKLRFWSFGGDLSTGLFQCWLSSHEHVALARIWVSIFSILSMFLAVLPKSWFLHIPWNDADALRSFNPPSSGTLKASTPHILTLALSRLNDDTLSFHDV